MYDPMADLSKDNCGKTVTCPECNGAGYGVFYVTGYGHACGGDEKLCQTMCPVQVEEEQQCICPMCNGEKEITR